MAIFKQKNSKYWWISVYVPGRKKRIRVSTHTTDKHAAVAVERVMQLAQTQHAQASKLHEILDSVLDNNGIPVDQIWNQYCVTIESMGKDMTTPIHQIRNTAVRRFVAYVERMYPSVNTMHAISRNIAINYVQYLTKQGYKSNTIKFSINALSYVWKAIAKQNIWEKLSPATSDEMRREAFTKEQESMVLEESKKHGWYLLSIVARYTGLRFNDVLSLRQSNIDRENKCIRITPAKTRRYGTQLVIPLPETIFDMLPSSDPLFPKPPKPFREVLNNCGLGKEYTFHSWRHTFRTRLSEAGVSDDIARRLGGWSSLKMASHYDHAERIAELRAAISATCD